MTCSHEETLHYIAQMMVERYKQYPDVNYGDEWSRRYVSLHRDVINIINDALAYSGESA